MSTTFKSMTTLEPKTILVVDSLNLAFRWKHSGAKEFVDEYLKTIESFKKSFKASKVIITCDQGSSSYRKNIFSDYKGNREEKRALQTEKEQADFEAFFQEFKRVIALYEEVDDYPVLKFSGVEADDIAAYIVSKYKKTHKIWLVSSDRDWDLLVDENVSRFSYVTRKEVTLENWHEHYECTPEQYISIKCLMGDSGDNIPGVDKVGPKTAQKLVDTYGSTYDLIANMPIPGKYVYISNLNKFGEDNLIRNYKLMDLVTHCRDALGQDNCNKIDEVLERYINGN